MDKSGSNSSNGSSSMSGGTESRGSEDSFIAALHRIES